MKYVAIPRADWDEPPDVEAVSTRTVLVDDDAPIKTGLLDHHGTPLYRIREKIRFGFVK